MNHLNDVEFVDLIDGRLASARLRHAEECGACRARADGLRAALAQAADDGAWEPSPLFWDHFGSRVSEAIRNEAPIGAQERSWSAWLRSPARALFAAASVAVLMVVAVAWRATLHAPAVSQTSVISTAPAAPLPGDTDAIAPDGGEDLDSDAAWAVVRSAADGLGWDGAHAAGLSARPGSAERIALELTAAERVELARLIQGELKRPGA
jgi:hypothetical protein